MNEEGLLDVEQDSEIISDDTLSDQTDNPIGVVEVVPMTEEEIVQLAQGDILSDIGLGTISDSYLDYFEGIVQKLNINEHYVIWRASDNQYYIAYGEDIEENSGYFVGDCDYVTIFRDSGNTYNSPWYVSHGYGELDLHTTTYFVYSDLGKHPTVERGFSSLEAHAILFAIGFAVVYSVCHDIFDYVLGHLRR